ncbi:hypothetical protein DY000_02059474 [Brassica cretica]|uniref:Uncharacterized protein n=1 Tax=Brassica cretica TaxID=69181 RepID=A0ABQ7B3D6_BRACR|nr:hypothetical protein DY000_02059474 [Brassica cretica]
MSLGDGSILCSALPASPKVVLSFSFKNKRLRVRSRLSIDALRGFRWVLFSSDEDLIGEDGGSLCVSSGGGGMVEELCVRHMFIHSLLSAPGVYVSMGGGLCFFGPFV